MVDRALEAAAYNRLMGRLGALLLAVVMGGCSTGITAPMDMGAPQDLSAAASDMTTGCTLAFTGDVNMTVPCRIFLCHPTGGTFDDLDLAGPIDNPTGAHAAFDADGMFALQSYTRAQLRSVDIGINSATKSYRAIDTIGSAAVTISAVTPPSMDPCDGVAHGTATATLDEYVIDDGGMASPGPGRVMLTATF
jgi:hypothetical protein